MLEYIYNLFKYYFIDIENTKEFNGEKLGISTFTLYNGQIGDVNNGILTYPSVMIDINIGDNIKRYSNKYQVADISVDTYITLQIPTQFNSNEDMINYNLNSLKLFDKIYRRLENKNGNIQQLLDSNRKLFADSIHRYGGKIMQVGGLSKTNKTTFNFLLHDFTAMDEKTFLNFTPTLQIGAIIKN